MLRASVIFIALLIAACDGAMKSGLNSIPDSFEVQEHVYYMGDFQTVIAQ